MLAGGGSIAVEFCGGRSPGSGLNGAQSEMMVVNRNLKGTWKQILSHEGVFNGPLLSQSKFSHAWPCNVGTKRQRKALHPHILGLPEKQPRQSSIWR
jgi:hypothetical protein